MIDDDVVVLCVSQKHEHPVTILAVGTGVDAEQTGLAGVVGMGAGTHPSLVEADGGSRLQRGGPEAMLERASNYRRDVIEGRWVIETRHQRKRWEVIVEPDGELRLLVVVTAFPVWES